MKVQPRLGLLGQSQVPKIIAYEGGDASVLQTLGVWPPNPQTTCMDAQRVHVRIGVQISSINALISLGDSEVKRSERRRSID